MGLSLGIGSDFGLVFLISSCCCSQLTLALGLGLCLGLLHLILFSLTTSLSFKCSRQIVSSHGNAIGPLTILEQYEHVNCALSIAQRRYLLNASRISGTGYLNVQLSNDKMKHVLTLEDTQPCTWTNPAYLKISDTHGKTFKPYAEN